MVLAAALVAACAPEPREAEPLVIETVEVGATVDEGLSTEADEKGGRPAASEDWILTGMLPDDLPLHRPARLVDSVETADGGRVFVFHTTTPLETVRTGLARRLGAAGWSVTTDAENLRVTKGPERAEFALAPLRPGTEIRVTY